jgi:hypothetical protein
VAEVASEQIELTESIASTPSPPSQQKSCVSTDASPVMSIRTALLKSFDAMSSEPTAGPEGKGMAREGRDRVWVKAEGGECPKVCLGWKET